MNKAFLIKNFEVTVNHNGEEMPAEFFAATYGKARTAAWHSYTNLNPQCSYRDFMKISKVRRVDSPAGFGRPITVDGKPAFFVENNGQYIGFSRPGCPNVRYSHPLDVEELT